MGVEIFLIHMKKGSITMAKGSSEKVKKPIYKKWWFWVIIVVLVFGVFGSLGGGSDEEATAEEATTEETTAEADVITLTAGEMGDYGKEIVMNEGTDMEENLIVYYVPAGEYTVKNVGEFRTQVSVYEGFARDESTGYDDYTNVGDTPSIDVNETADITVPDGWFIEIHEPCVIELVAK